MSINPTPPWLRVAVGTAALVVMCATSAHAAPQPLTKALAKQAVSKTIKAHYGSHVEASIRCRRVVAKSRKTSCGVSFYVGDNVYAGTVTVVLARDQSGRFVRGRGTFSGKYTSEYPECKSPCSARERWSERFTLPAPKRPAPAKPTPDDQVQEHTDAEEAQQTIDRAIYTNITSCAAQVWTRKAPAFCYAANNDITKGWSLVPTVIAIAVEAAYVTYTATPQQSAMLACWLTWATSRDYFPPACTRSF